MAPKSTKAAAAARANTGTKLAQNAEAAAAALGTSVLGEIVWYDRKLTATNRALVEKYLKTKWGTP